MADQFTRWPRCRVQDAVRLGITVVATAGDDLASERMQDGKVHVNYPASSPYALGCGGTRITLDGARNAIMDEAVWNDNGERGTGGGISEEYVVPAFQTAARIPASLNDNKPGRGVPDVAAAACADQRLSRVRQRKGRGRQWHKCGRSALGRFHRTDQCRARSCARLCRRPNSTAFPNCSSRYGGNNMDFTGLGYSAGVG